MEEILNILRAQLLGLLTVLPVLLKAIFLFSIGVVFAKFLRKALRKMIAAVGLDRLVNKINSIELVEQSGFELKISELLSSIGYYSVLLIFGMAAIEALGMQMMSDLLADFINYIPRAFTAFVVLLVGLFFSDFVKKIVQATCRSLNITAGTLIANVIFYFIFLNVVLIALRQAELQTSFMENNITVILAGIAAAFAIGYGLASRDVMSNLLAAYYNKGRLEVGDEVSIEGHKGEVIQISNNAVTLRAANTDIIVPLHKLTSSGMTIHSRRSRPNALPPNV